MTPAPKERHRHITTRPDAHLGAELDQNHVLVGRGVTDDLHVLHDLVERRHELHEVVAGHGRRDGQDANHGTAADVFGQGRHFTAATQKRADDRDEEVCCYRSPFQIYDVCK